MKAFIALLCITLAGCATDKTKAEQITHAGLVDGAIAAAQAPLFKLSCPATGCILGSLEVGNPGAGAQLADVVKVVMTPQVSEAGQNFRAVLGVLGQVGGYAVIGHAASQIVGKVVGGYTSGFSSNVAIAGKIPQPGSTSTITNTTNTTTTLSGTGVIGSGTHNNPVTTTTDRHDVINPQIPCVVTPTFTSTGAPAGFIRTGC